MARLFPARPHLSLRQWLGCLSVGLLLLAAVVYILVSVVGLALNTPDPVGIIIDDASTVWDSFTTLIVGKKSFDPPVVVELTPTVQRPAAAPSLTPLAATPTTPPATPTEGYAEIKRAAPSTNGIHVPVYDSFDLLSSYLGNLDYPIMLDGKPWDNGSVNVYQLNRPNGGNSYWDYWIESEPWNSPNHMWRDDLGKWHTYSTETIKDATGKNVTEYILVDRKGPGVMDKLWFTHDAVGAIMGFFNRPDPPEVKEWGNLDKLGNLRIEVDDKIVYDGPIQDWFSGDALGLTPELKAILVWNYGQFGSDGNIIPIPYQDHIKVSVYGGSGKPKWFMATGMTLAPTTRVMPFTGSPNDLPVEQMAQLAQNVLNPERYINTLPGKQSYSLVVKPGTPTALSLEGSGTIASLHMTIKKEFDPKDLWLQVRYGSQLGIDLPLVAFFGEPSHVSPHRSAPIGIIDLGDSYLFYSNFPMPYQQGIEIDLATRGTTAIPVQVEAATTRDTFSTQFWVKAQPAEALTSFGPDYTIDLAGSGKMVGLVLQTYGEQYDKVPHFFDKGTGKEDPSRRVWPMGYLEGNLTLTDGVGTSRHYSGQEDWAEGGYYFNSGYTTPTGGSNRPFGGVLRYHQGGNNGYATLFRYFNDLSAFPFKDGLHLTFGHGTWENNYAVTYAATVYYYEEVPGIPSVTLPAVNTILSP